MQKTIWKYPLEITDIQTIRTPPDSKFLSLIAQEETPTLYFITSSKLNVELVDKKIYIYGTGFIIEEDTYKLKFLGTVTQKQDSLVWHIFIEE